MNEATDILYISSQTIVTGAAYQQFIDIVTAKITACAGLEL